MDKQAFDQYKADLIADNEAKYGEEIREKYGEKVVTESNQKFMNLPQETFERMQALEASLKGMLPKAAANNQPASEEGREVARTHAAWLQSVWPEGLFTPESHQALAAMYTQDERFKKYYDDLYPGATTYLFEAIQNYYQDETQA